MTLNVHNHDAKCSSNGTLLTDIIIKSRNLKPLNFTDKHIPKWTHINTKKLSERSILDYVIIQNNNFMSKSMICQLMKINSTVLSD